MRTVELPVVRIPRHCFQKRAKHGIQTPQREIDLVKRRLKTAAADYATRRAGTA